MTRLDDLLGYDEDLEPSRRRQRNRWVRPTMGIAACFVAAYVVEGILVITGVGVPYLFLVSLFLALVALRGVLGGVVVPPLPSTLRDTPSGPALEAPGDGIRNAVNRWEVRLVWSQQDTRFGPIMQQLLVDLADERLRLHHGISRAADPVRARELLGPDLWTLIHEPVSRSLTPRELATLVARMEAL